MHKARRRRESAGPLKEIPMRNSPMLSTFLVIYGKAAGVFTGLSSLRQRLARVFPAERFAERDGMADGPAARDYMESLRLPPQLTSQMSV
jgi:hypothetical protein